MCSSDLNIEITAVQLALWHYTDDINPTSANLSWDKTFYPAGFTGDAKNTTIGEVLARYDTLVAAAEADPLENPQPAITMTPATSSVDAGTPVVLTVTGTDIEGGITVAGDDPNTKRIVMELVDGKTSHELLRDRLKTGQTRSPQKRPKGIVARRR